MDASSGRLQVAEDRPILTNVAIAPHLHTTAFFEAVRKQLSVKVAVRLPTEPSVTIAHVTVADDNIVADLAEGLLRIDRVDVQLVKLGAGYNHAYYALGQAYGRAIGVGISRLTYLRL